jgi:hypothetical protein
VVAVPELIAELEQTRDARRLEIVADLLGAARDRRAVAPLLRRLGDPLVLENAYAEDAVCAALVALGVMRAYGASRYGLLPRHELDRDTATALAELDAGVPLRYFLTRR